VGGDLSYELSENWNAVVKGTVGGFGVSAQIAAEVFAGVNYRVNDWFSATLGYRYLHEQYDRTAYSFNLNAQGFLAGVGFHF
jgi:opacity protein-like surface antigen